MKNKTNNDIAQSIYEFKAFIYEFKTIFCKPIGSQNLK
jgi:hypothetical protein